MSCSIRGIVVSERKGVTHTMVIIPYYEWYQNDQPYAKIPKVLINDAESARISAMAKFLYAIMLDRAGLSLDNGWVREGKVYIIMTLSEICQLMGCSKPTAVKLLDELERSGLILREVQKVGEPSIIFVNQVFSGQ